MADDATLSAPEAEGEAGTQLVRAVGWQSGFWNALGGASLMVFSVGYIAVLDGPVSFVIWIVSVVIGFFMCFIYGQMASAFPDKSGGPSCFGAWTWGRHLTVSAPFDLMGYWFAYSPIIAIGALLIGDYVEAQWFPGQTWGWDWAFIHINFPFVVGWVAIIGLLGLNNFGIKESSWLSAAIGVFSMVPLALLIVIPIFRGAVDLSNLHPFVTPNGTWASWTTFELICAGLFVAGWSSYAAEVSLCYTAEFANPKRDTPLAIFSSAAIYLFYYGLGPFVLITAVGVGAIQGDPATAFRPLAEIAFGPLSGVFIAFLLGALLLSIQMAILGSARTIYQASNDGWTFGYFRWTSRRGVPLKAMGTDIAFNTFLMLLGNPIAILAASTIGYLSFHMVNTLAGYILDRHHSLERVPSYRAPKTLIRLGIVWTAVNFLFIFVGSPSWGWSKLGLGWLIVLLGIPFWYYRVWSDKRRSAEALAGSSGGVLAGTEGLGEAGVQVVTPGLENPTRRRQIDGELVATWQLLPMGASLTALGLFFYLVQWQGWDWAYIVGLALLFIWTSGFIVARKDPRKTWFSW